MDTRTELLWFIVLIVIIVAIIAIICIAINNEVATDSSLNEQASIAYISTGIFGRLDGEPIDRKIYNVAIGSQLVPLKEGSEIIAVNVPGDELATVIPQLYEQGIRFFVGATGTDELISIQDFLSSHPDVLWITSASTGPLTNKPRNIFRLVSNDNNSIPLFQANLNSINPNYVIYYDPNNVWASNLALQLDSQAIASTDVAVLATVPAEQAILWINTDINPVLNYAAQINLPNQLILGDVAAYAQLEPQQWDWINSGGQLYALTSWINSIYYEFAINVYGFPISPLINNVLTCLWYTLDTFKSGNEKRVEQMYQTYGPNLADVFDDGGDAKLREIVVVQAMDEEWNLILGQSLNPGQPFFAWLPHSS